LLPRLAASRPPRLARRRSSPRRRTWRALTAGDVAAITGLPIVATIPVNAATARAVDAGVLAMRLPADLAAAASQILDFTAAAVPG